MVVDPVARLCVYLAFKAFDVGLFNGAGGFEV